MFKYFSFIAAAVTIVVGQQIVSSIDIRGRQYTKEYVIQREIQHPLNVPLDSALAEGDRDRIENLRIFSMVTWQALPLEDGSFKLRYHVIESTRFMPIFSPIYEEDTGWSLVLGGIFSNFRGRNESLTIDGLIGGVDGYGIEFNNPWMVGDHVSLNLQVGKHFSNHVFLPYERQTSSFEINIGRYFGYQKRISLGFEYEQKDFVGDSTTIEFLYFAPQGSFAYDTRDIYNDPSEGIYIVHSAQYFMFSNIKGSSLFWNQSYSAFTSPIKGKHKTTLGANVSLNSTHGDLHPELFLIGLGGGYSVRGWQIETRELYTEENQSYRFGYFSAVSSLEIRQTIIPRFAIEQQSPFGPMKSEMGLQAAIFIDAGVTGNNWDDLKNTSPMMGTGLGIRIPVAMAGNIRFDYGWSFYEGAAVESSFHFSVGQKF